MAIDKSKTKSKQISVEHSESSSFSTIIATIGVILIFVGVAWLLANNWHVIPSALKILILFSATIFAYYVGTYLQINNYNKLGHSMFVLGSLLYTLSIFLIAQIFSTSPTLQGTAHLMLLSWVGVIIASYTFKSLPSLTVGFIEFLIWISMQYFAFEQFAAQSQPMGLLLFIYLFAGILFYGLNLFHTYKMPNFSMFYKWWCALYFLIFAYIITFQQTLPELWANNINYNYSSFYFMIILIIISLIIFVLGAMLVYDDKTYNRKELWLVIGFSIILIFIILISNTATKNYGICENKQCYDYKNQLNCDDAEMCQWKDNYCMQKFCGDNNLESCANKTEIQFEYYNKRYYSYNCYTNKNNFNNNNFCYLNYSTKKIFEPANYINCTLWENNKDSCTTNNQCAFRTQSYSYYGSEIKPTIGIWILWIFSNVLFVILILSIIGLGTIYKSKSAINLGIIFFILDIITRYIGFMSDYWGYTSLSVFFITGGIILILGGYYIEKWRQTLIQKIQ